MALVSWSDIPHAEGMRRGSVRQAVSGEKISAVRVVTEHDAFFDGTLHWHDNEQILIMVSGQVTLRIDDDEFNAVAGDFVYFPPGSRHAAIAVGSEGCVYYELFAPARFDQLPGWLGPSVLHFD